MKKKEVMGLPPGSAKCVFAHARWQKSRGRRPSMPFAGNKNPRVAALVARFYVLYGAFKLWRDQGKRIAHNDALMQYGLPADPKNKLLWHVGAELERLGVYNRGELKDIFSALKLARPHLSSFAAEVMPI